MRCSVLGSAVRCLVVILLAACSSSELEPGEPSRAAPDLILHGAAVYTLSSDEAWAEAVAVRGDEIQAVGSDEEILALAGTATRLVDATGTMVLPGLQDPHLHVVEAGLNQDLCYLEPGRSLAQYERAMRACGRRQSGQAWVRGAGPYAEDLLEGGELPIEVLDRAVPDRPALVLDAVGHAAWVNSRALEAIGLDQSSEDPAGGVLGREAGSGQLNGLLFEAAQYLAHDTAEPPSEENLERAYQALLQAQQTVNRHGITSVSDAGGYWPRGHHQVWARAEAAGTLTLRASNALFVYPYREVGEQLATLRSLFSSDPNRLLRFDQAKIYIDGIPSLGSAALLEPYEGTRNERGLLYFDRQRLHRYSRELSRAGFSLHLHATGDRGVRLGLDAIAATGAPAGPGLHRLTHLFFVHPQDMPRFAAQGVVADFQLGPFTASRDYERFIADLVGERARRALPFGELIQARAQVVLSSDWDAEPLAPFEMLQRGLQRHRDRIPDLAIGLRMMTLHAARALGHEVSTGSIEVGKKADLVVIDRNLFTVAESKIGRTRVLLTLLGGKAVYAARGWSL